MSKINILLFQKFKESIMKIISNTKIVFLLLLSMFLTFSCSSSDDNNTPPDSEDPDGSCYVQLFDGDNYTDDTITIDGPGEFSNLSNLPGADKDWNDEADSFKSGMNTTVTFWIERGFKGDSITYDGGAQEPSIDEPSSMKITCND